MTDDDRLYLYGEFLPAPKESVRYTRINPLYLPFPLNRTGGVPFPFHSQISQ